MKNSATGFFHRHYFGMTLLLIFVLALIFRLFQLGSTPATFYVDEVLSGYLGRYLLLNGQDLYGNIHPWLYFNKFGDYYILPPMYLDGISTFIFGVTRFAVRFPTALIGALAIFPMAGVTLLVFKNKIVALCAALLLAVTPWQLVLSRATTESVIELTMLLCVVWCLLKAVSSNRYRVLTLAILLSLASYLVYHTARVLVPLVWLGFLGIFFSTLRQKRSILAIVAVLTLGFFMLTVGISRTEWGKGRLAQTSIFSEQSGVSIKMTEMTYNLGPDSVFIARLFHNKVLGFGREFVVQYLSYFSPLFLFTDEAWIGTRYAVPETGPLYLITIVFLLGWLIPAKKQAADKNKALWLVLWLLLIAPLPAALTVIESPNVRRSLFMIVPILILAAGGWQKWWTFSWRSIKLHYFFGAILLVEVALFSYYYFVQSDMYSAVYRSDGQPEIADYVLKRNQVPQIYVNQSIDFPLYYLFAKQDFSPDFAKRFKFELKIDNLDKVIPTEFGCTTEYKSEFYTNIHADSLIIEPETCNLDQCRIIQIDTITGVNPLLKFRVLRKVRPEERPQFCLEKTAIVE